MMQTNILRLETRAIVTFMVPRMLILTLAGTPAAAGQEVSSNPVPRVVVVEESIDLGTIRQGDKADAVFVLRNEGDADLRITNVNESCGCTVADLPEERRTIAPGGELLLPVTFDSRDRRGAQNSKIRVTTNDPTRGVLELTLTADVFSPFVIEPSRDLPFQNGRRGRPLARKLRVFPTEPEADIEIRELTFDDPAVRFDIAPVEDKGRRGYMLSFSLDAETPLGDLKSKGTLKMRVKDEELETTLSVYGSVVGDLAYRPSHLSVLRDVRRDQELPPISVLSTEKKPFNILSVDAGPYLTPTVVPRNPEGFEYRISLRLAPQTPAGPLAALLSVVTDTAEHPRLEIPVFVNVPRWVVVDPLLIRLWTDGSRTGRERRVILEASEGTTLDLRSVSCDLPFVETEVLPALHERRKHIRTVAVRLAAAAPAGPHDGTLTIQTSVAGSEQIQIPVEVDVLTTQADLPTDVSGTTMTAPQAERKH